MPNARQLPWFCPPRKSSSASRNYSSGTSFLVFLIGALGTRRGEVGALRWMDCDFVKEVFYIRDPPITGEEEGI